MAKMFDENTLYMSEGTRTKKNVSPVATFVSAFLAIVFMVLAVQTVLPNFSQGTRAEASSPEIFCSTGLGLNMENKGSWNDVIGGYPHSDKSPRTWTMQEAFGNVIGFTNYTGEGQADGAKGVRAKPEVQGASSMGNYSSVVSKLEGARTLGKCTTVHLSITISNGFMWLASSITKIAQFFAVSAFDPTIICKDPNASSGNCLNLLKIIGGTGNSNGGIIGALTSSVYYPLLVIAVFVAAMWVLHEGIVKRSIRKAFFGVLWIVFSVIIGLLFLLNPLLITKAPMAISNAVTTCIVGSFNGENCMTSGSTGSKIDFSQGGSTSNTICVSSAGNLSLDEKMSMTANSLTCSIWKAFVLNPYSEASFGTSFNNLDTMDVNNKGLRDTITKAGFKPEDFCVNLGSTASMDSMKGKRLNLDSDSNKVCNLMAYQMYLMTNASSGNDAKFSNSPNDLRWYKVIITAANSDDLWNNWSATATSANHKTGIAILSIFVSILGTALIVVTSAFALVYYFASVILMAFAPLFLLIGIHPTKGKKLMLGWGEKVVSNILKYIFSAIFLIVAIAIYSGILGNISSVGLTILFVAIITMALFLYRKELIDLFGRVNAGGDQMSNAFMDKISGGFRKSKDNVANFNRDVIGSAIGSAAAGAGVAAGVKDGAFRNLKRKGGVVGNVVRQYDRAAIDNKSDLNAQARSRKEDSVQAATQVALDRGDYDNATQELNDYDGKITSAENFIKDNMAAREASRALEPEALQQMDTDGTAEKDARLKQIDSDAVRKINAIRSDKSLTQKERNEQIRGVKEDRKEERAKALQDFNEFKQFLNLQKLENGNNKLQAELKVAVANGDTESAAGIRTQLLDGQERAAKIRSTISDENLDKNERMYKSTMQRTRTANNVNYNDKMEEEFVKEEELLATASERREQLLQKAEKAEYKYKDSIAQKKAIEAEAAYLSQSVTNLRAGDHLTVSDTEKIRALAQEHARNRYNQEISNLEEKGIPDSPLIDPNSSYSNRAPIYGAGEQKEIPDGNREKNSANNRNNEQHQDTVPGTKDEAPFDKNGRSPFDRNTGDNNTNNSNNRRENTNNRNGNFDNSSNREDSSRGNEPDTQPNSQENRQENRRERREQSQPIPQPKPQPIPQEQPKPQPQPQSTPQSKPVDQQKPEEKHSTEQRRSSNSSENRDNSSFGGSREKESKPEPRRETSSRGKPKSEKKPSVSTPKSEEPVTNRYSSNTDAKKVDESGKFGSNENNGNNGSTGRKSTGRNPFGRHKGPETPVEPPSNKYDFGNGKLDNKFGSSDDKGKK